MWLLWSKSGLTKQKTSLISMKLQRLLSAEIDYENTIVMKWFSKKVKNHSKSRIEYKHFIEDDLSGRPLSISKYLNVVRSGCIIMVEKKHKYVSILIQAW